MMVIFVTLFLISIGEALCLDVECREREGAKCHDLERPTEFPSTPEQFHSDCRNLLTFMNCLSDVMDDCGHDDEEVRKLGRLIFYMQMRVCNPESHIYEALTSNIECIKTTLPKVSPVCGERSKDKRMNQVEDALEDYLLEKLNIYEHFSVEDKRNCMDMLFGTACISVFLSEECGRAVGDAALDMIINMNYIIGELCPENVLNELPYVVNALHSIAEAEEEVETAIKKKK